jgi:hypothetical protein
MLEEVGHAVLLGALGAGAGVKGDERVPSSSTRCSGSPLARAEVETVDMPGA